MFNVFLIFFGSIASRYSNYVNIYFISAYSDTDNANLGIGLFIWRNVSV